VRKFTEWKDKKSSFLHKLMLPSDNKRMASSLLATEPQGSRETFSRALSNLQSFAARFLSYPACGSLRYRSPATWDTCSNVYLFLRWVKRERIYNGFFCSLFSLCIFQINGLNLQTLACGGP
jgi:hypothetical protein